MKRKVKHVKLTPQNCDVMCPGCLGPKYDTERICTECQGIEPVQMTVEQELEPVDILGQFDPINISDLHSARRVYMNGKRLPPALEQIILTGLDTLAGAYLNQVESEMKSIGWSFE
jgi:hypothetical protein